MYSVEREDYCEWKNKNLLQQTACGGTKCSRVRPTALPFPDGSWLQHHLICSLSSPGV